MSRNESSLKHIVKSSESYSDEAKVNFHICCLLAMWVHLVTFRLQK